MTDNNQQKTTSNKELFRLLNNEWMSFDGYPVIKEAQRNPRSAAERYDFRGDYCYPLHKAVMLKANLDVVEAIYNSYPQAMKIKCGRLKNTVLHIAVGHGAVKKKKKASIEVVSFLLTKWPDAVREKNIIGYTPLHSSCRFEAPIEVISKLLQSWPDAAKEKDYKGYLPLHMALTVVHPVKETVISLLLDHYPDALKEKAEIGNTPLHIAIWMDVSLEVILIILQGYPEATREINDESETPLDLVSNENVEKTLSYVSQLCGSTMDVEKSKEMMDFFTQIKLWKGVALILDRYPPLSQNLDINTNLFPQFLSVVGRCCKLKTMWHVVSNELDIMEGVC